MNIVIIGAGQLGSRHLQGLALIEQQLNIYIVDPSENSLEVSKSRFYEVDCIKNKNLTLLKDIEGLPNEVEFAIIATTSKYRLDVMKELLNKYKVNYLLLEKFLFPIEEEYLEAKQLLASLNTATYVNCTRRQFDGYKKLKEKLSASSQIHITVEGSDWNLASNAIHFVDLFQFLTSCESIRYDYAGSSLQVKESKHNGYVEFTGHIKAKSIEGDTLNMLCSKNENMKFLITIEAGGYSYSVNEAQKILSFNKEEKNFPVYFQSQLTNKTFEQLQKEGKSDLIRFEDSCELHLELLKLFNHFLKGEEGIVT